MALTILEVILNSRGKHDKHSTNVDATCSEAIPCTDKIHKPKCVYIHSQHMHASTAEATCFFIFLYITHVQENAHTCIHVLDTHISSGTVATAAAVGCHHWSCLHTFDPFGRELYCWRRKKQQNWANVCLCPPWEGRAFLLPKYKSQDFGCILPGQREAMVERKIPIRHWSEPN